MTKNIKQNKRNKRDNGTGSIVKRSDGRWMGSLQVGFNEDGKPKRICVYGKTEAEAKRKLKEKRNEYIKNNGVVQKNISVKKWFNDWLEDTMKLTLKPRSYDAKERCIDKFIVPALGNMKITEVTQKDIQKLISQMSADGYSYSQIHKVYNTINQRYKQGILSREVFYNPALGVILPKETKSASSQSGFALSRDEVDLLVKKAKETYPNGTPIYPRGDFIILLLYTGLRIGEALALTWDDINFEQKTINVNKNVTTAINRDKDLINPKTKKPYKTITVLQNSTKTNSSTRVIPMSKMAEKALKNIQKYNGNKPYVLANSRGNYCNYSNMNRMLKGMLKSAGITINYSIHSLRHTFASMLFSKDVDVKIVSEILGHSSVSITYNTYVHLIKEQKAKAVGLLDIIDF